MDHLDKLDYAFLGFCVAGFLFCVIAIWRQKPYRQIEAHLLQLKTSDPTLHAEQTKETAMAENTHRFGMSAIDELNGHRWARREPKKNFALLMSGLIILLVLLYVQIVW
jgi:hypothetical protein